MSSKWASLNLEAGASPSTLRKASLLKSARNSVSSVTQAATAPFGNEWGIATVIIVIAAVAILISYNSTKSTTPLLTARPLAAPAQSSVPAPIVVVQSVAVPENAPVAVDDAPVEPKFALSDRFFSASEGPSDQFLDNSSFNDFQSAFFGASERPIHDRESSSDFVGSFEGLKDYLKTHDVPEKLLTASSSSKVDIPSVFGGNADVSDSEARMLAAEAFQIPSGTDDVLVISLREILAAYTEARKAGLVLPGSPDEQVKILKSLARRSGQIGELSKSILGRI